MADIERLARRERPRRGVIEEPSESEGPGAIIGADHLVPLDSAAELFTPVDEGYRAWRKEQFRMDDGDSLCYLCRYGDRIVDAGGSGSRLFGAMIVMIEKYHGNKRDQELVRMIGHYIDSKVRPALAEAKRPLQLPDFDPTNVLEHLTTSQHTMSSRFMCSNLPRFLERIMLQASDHIISKSGGVDVRVMEGVRKYAETILKFHSVNPTRMAFGSARADGINMDTAAMPFVSAQSTLQIREEQPAFMSRFIADFHAVREAAALLPPPE